jgi:signal transduction histidine kinase
VSRRYRTSRTGTGRLAQWWPVLLSLLVVLVPTACVLWFMAEAVENRRLVVRRSLADADLTIAQERLERYWQQQAAALEKAWTPGEPPSKVFQECVLAKLADSVVCYAADGRPAYPTDMPTPREGMPPTPVPGAAPDGRGVDWAAAEALEYRQGRLDEAAAAYQAIAEARAHASEGMPPNAHADLAQDSFDASLAAQALQAQARCLAKAKRTDDAIRLLTETLQQPQYRQAVDAAGRLIAAAADLRAVELIGDEADPRFRAALGRLEKQLNDYAGPTLSAPERVFLMDRLQELAARAVEFPTLEAEKLAAEFCEANPLPSRDAALRLSQSPGIWQLASPDRRVYALYRTASVLRRSKEAIAARALKSGAEVTPVPPGENAPADAAAHSAEAGPYLPGWRLTRSLADGEESGPVRDAQIAAYFWTGILVIAAMSVFAAIIAGAMRRQIRLARLKNDLVATVSHELKTPLSSIRLLVDTLLSNPDLADQQVHEYLQLVAKENTRLSRLIDNFLTFSRMERHKQAFEFVEVRPADVIDAAVQAAGEQLHAPGCRFELEVPAELPAIQADADALVTVLLNLLDNACKYSGDRKHIVLRASADDDSVRFEVQDSGVGLSRAAAKKVFRRFYQVDRRVSRAAGGVGLGLSIVQFIVAAHGGTVRVRSRPGQGSIFTVSIPRGAPPAEPVPPRDTAANHQARR